MKPEEIEAIKLEHQELLVLAEKGLWMAMFAVVYWVFYALNSNISSKFFLNGSIFLLLGITFFTFIVYHFLEKIRKKLTKK